MTLFEAVIIGIIQGLTEFLPVSSSGHIELAKAVFGAESVSEEPLLFSLVVHSATALSTITVFRKDITSVLTGLFKFSWNEEWQFMSKIIVSAIPAGMVYVFFEDRIEQLFTGNIMLVGLMLCVTALLLLLTHFIEPKNEDKQVKEVSFGQSLLIGLAQAVAIMPGISRSGATVSTALLAGVSRDKAARFSFLMILLPILGMTALKAFNYFRSPVQGLAPEVLGAGFLAAFITGVLACIWMLSLVRKGKLIYFALYCFAAGAASLAWAFLG